MSAFASWAVLELMGHRTVPGFVEEVELAGAKFFRVRVPALLQAEEGKAKLDLEQLQLEQFYSPSSVYALTPTTEGGVARALAEQLRWRSLPALPPPGTPEPAAAFEDATQDALDDAGEEDEDDEPDEAGSVVP